MMCKYAARKVTANLPFSLPINSDHWIFSDADRSSATVGVQLPRLFDRNVSNSTQADR